MDNIKYSLTIAKDGKPTYQIEGSGFIGFVSDVVNKSESGSIMMAEGMLPPRAVMSAVYSMLTNVTEQFDFLDTVVLTNLVKIGLLESCKKCDRLDFNKAFAQAVNIANADAMEMLRKGVTK